MHIDPSGKSAWLLIPIVLGLATILSSCYEPDETVDGTPLSPKPAKYYDTYDEALYFTIKETARLALIQNWKYEYAGSVYQFNDNPYKFYSATGSTMRESGMTRTPLAVVMNKDTIILADVHTHPYETMSHFNIPDYEFIKRYKADAYVIEPSHFSSVGYNIYFLSKDANNYSEWRQVLLEGGAIKLYE